MMSGYSIESVIAEKYQAIVKLEVLNNRMKDFYDVWALAQAQIFDGATLAAAIKKTFDARKTPLPDDPHEYLRSR